MGLEPMLQEIPFTDEQTQLRSQFFEATGYGPSDILSLNYSTREFLTTNGGHYRVVPDGIVQLAGPPAALEDRWDF